MMKYTMSSVHSTGPAHLGPLRPSRAPRPSCLPALRNLELTPEVRKDKGTIQVQLMTGEWITIVAPTGVSLPLPVQSWPIDPACQWASSDLPLPVPSHVSTPTPTTSGVDPCEVWDNVSEGDSDEYTHTLGPEQREKTASGEMCPCHPAL